MNIKNKIASAKAILKAKFFFWKKKVLFIIDELAEMGTQIIIFSGGKPLLRDDIVHN